MNEGRDGYLPPPPPPPPPPMTTASSGGSTGTPTRRAPAPVSPRSVATHVPGYSPQVHTNHHSPTSAYTYTSPASNLNASRSPYGPAGLSPLGPRTESPMAYRNASGGMTMEYNPQQWGRGSPAPVVYRPHATLTVSAVPRPLDDSGRPLDSPPPPYTPNAQGRTGPRSPPLLQTANLRNTSIFGHDVASPASAITVISPLSMRSRSEAPMNFPPPPPNANRSGSGSRSRFGLSALARGRSSDRVNSANNTPAIEALQYSTREALANAPVQWSSPQMRPLTGRQSSHLSNRSTVYMPASHEPLPLAPAARRSASTGTMGQQQTQQWAPGMPLPPPPSAPPPGGSRSSSLTRAGLDLENAISVPSSDASNMRVPIIAAPTRRPHHRGTQLGPIPPTPAGYGDGEFPQSPMPPGMRGRSPAESDPAPLAPVDFSDVVSNSSSNLPDPSRISTSTSWSGSLKREPSSKGIRERRSESRAARDRIAEFAGESTSDIVQSPQQVAPADLVLSPISSAGRITRSGAMKKSRPSPVEVSRSTPTLKTPQRSTTPQDSPAFETKNPFSRSPPVILAKVRPDHLKSSGDVRSSPAQVALPDSARTIPNSATTLPASATRASSNGSNWQPDSGESFAISSLKRHQEFVRKETSATSDAERIQLFAEYMVAESRIRRDEYAAAFVTMESSDVMDLTRNMWRPLVPTPTAARPASAVPSSASTMPHPIRTDSMQSFASMSSPLSGSQANFTPLTEPESPASNASSSGARDCGTWARHQPVLSPIPSMAMSTVADEEDSRGRPASRWWESSQGSTGASQRVERTKRESKFMGVHREALASLQWQEEPSPSLHDGTPRTIGDYPIEKSGWHDDGSQAGPAYTPRNFLSSVPPTPDPHKVDVSRLVTLPPPYPRHYPAMSNNHPDLAAVRFALDALRDMGEITERRESFIAKITQRRDRHAREAAERHTQMRRNIQEQLQVGQMNYAQAAVAEDEFNVAEARTTQATVRTEYDHFQPEVMGPLQAIIKERITRGTFHIIQLCSGLSEDPSPDQSQEEGDEQPELLERLNLLKWLFEAREAQHKALDELECERDDRYREVVIMPLRNSGDDAKLHGAQQFFENDRQERKMNYEKAVSKRYDEFAKIVEKNVSRGVEDQLSAFWDIAPGLLAVVQKVPENLTSRTGDFELHVPPSEYEENPQYEQHPLQYLYTLLAHAEKSAYQFIESQVNLMCLLHEAHTGLMAAGIRLMECQRFAEGEDRTLVRQEMGECRKAEEQRLTHELKEKVETVESQWREGLGSGLAAVKERVGDYLQESGGWDESLLE